MNKRYKGKLIHLRGCKGLNLGKVIGEELVPEPVHGKHMSKRAYLVVQRIGANGKAFDTVRVQKRCVVMRHGQLREQATML